MASRATVTGTRRRATDKGDATVEIHHLGRAVGLGALAGLAGIVAMTAGERLEMGLTGRPPSLVPGRVAARLLGRPPGDEGDLARLSTRMHWGHGVVGGTLRGLLGAFGLRGTPATLLHFALLWGGDAALYRGLGIAPPPWAWGAGDLATDVTHKGLYAVVTGAVHDRLAP